MNQFIGVASALIPFLKDNEVTDLLINGTGSFYVERSGHLVMEQNPFENGAQLADFIERLLIPIGKRVDAAVPYLDGKLLDGSRFHLILPPLALDGPIISIRKRRKLSDRISLLSFSDEATTHWLLQRVEERKNILVAGATGSGKTTLLSRLIETIPPNERIALVEETSEILCDHPHVIRLEARAKTPDGTGEVTMRDLIRNTLRMRPDRLIVGECRGGEAFDMLQAMNTGHAGSLATIHANSARDALKKLESLVLLSGFSIPVSVARDWVASTIHFVVFLTRKNGLRRIHEIVQVQGLEGEVYRVLPHYAGERHLGYQLSSSIH